MPRSVYQPPFHRRILPWVFVAIFLVLAPTIVFYTSGYRFNPKKNAIERNGTLIVDSLPRSASVFLNGKDVDDNTPTTLQNVAPGPYDIRVTRDGYLPWEKTLDVRAEQVTFANTIRLWKVGEPTLIQTSATPSIAIYQGASTSTITTSSTIGNLSLEKSTSTGALLLRSRSFRDQIFQLPRGNWLFAGQEGSFTLLKDGDHWLSMRISLTGNSADDVTGDYPRWLPDSKVPTALFLNGNEIWKWELGSAPILIARQSSPFVQVAWHPGASTIFVATDHEVYALELDDRDGMQKTSLGSFDEVKDMAWNDGSLYISAVKQGVKGVFRRTVE